MPCLDGQRSGEEGGDVDGACVWGLDGHVECDVRSGASVVRVVERVRGLFAFWEVFAVVSSYGHGVVSASEGDVSSDEISTICHSVYPAFNVVPFYAHRFDHHLFFAGQINGNENRIAWYDASPRSVSGSRDVMMTHEVGRPAVDPCDVGCGPSVSSGSSDNV